MLNYILNPFCIHLILPALFHQDKCLQIDSSCLNPREFVWQFYRGSTIILDLYPQLNIGEEPVTLQGRCSTGCTASSKEGPSPMLKPRGRAQQDGMGAEVPHHAWWPL